MAHYPDVVETQPQLSWVKGALAGLVGTVPMTVFMLVTQRFLPKGQRYALPPEIIITDLAHKAHIRHKMSKAQILVATLISHFGYGAAAGALYSPVSKKVPLPALVKGSIFSFAVWAASYQALLPLIGISESAKKEPMRRNLMMIVAHLVWGSTTAMVVDVLS